MQGKSLLFAVGISAKGAQIQPAMALVSWEMDGEVCCLALIKTDELAGMVKDMLGPMMKEMVK